MTIYYSEMDTESPRIRQSQPSAHQRLRRRGKGTRDHRSHQRKNHGQKRPKKQQRKLQQQKKRQEHAQRALVQTPFDLSSLDLKSFDLKNFDPKTFDPKSIGLDSIDLKDLDMNSLDVKKLGEKLTGTLAKSSLPAGLTFPKELTLEQLQSIIAKFHWNETRTDVLAPLPMDFEPDKSIFTFLYTMNVFKDPTVRAWLRCAVMYRVMSHKLTPKWSYRIIQ